MVAGSLPEVAATVIRAVSPKRDDHRLPDTAEPTLGDERARSYCSAVRGATDVTVPVRGRSSRASGSYTVERGDTLPRIASRYRVSVGDLRRWNKIGRLTVGQKLTIQTRAAPVKGKPASKSAKGKRRLASPGRILKQSSN